MRVWLACLIAAFATPVTAGCNGTDAPCETAMGSYHIALPETAEGPLPALVFLHGAGGKGTGALRMRAALERGYAVIGPNGLDREGRFGTGWYFHPDRPKTRDELAFIREVIADAGTRFDIDASQILLGGFSIGGSMTSYLACAAPDLAKGFAPVAGGFWRPHPELGACNGAVNLLHTHGWRDKTVPLEGRPLGGGRIYQGDVFVTLQIWREENGCTGMRADTFDTESDFWRRKWDSCDEGALEFALHQGGHGIPKGWSEMALDWFETLE